MNGTIPIIIKSFMRVFMNDKNTVALAVVIIACTAIIAFGDQAREIATMAISGLLGMASGQALGKH
jgi:Mg2+/citrate symporter